MADKPAAENPGWTAIQLDAARFKNGVIASLNTNTAFPVYIIWYDKNQGGWCKGISKELQSVEAVKKQVGNMMWGDIQHLKLLDGVVKKSG